MTPKESIIFSCIALYMIIFSAIRVTHIDKSLDTITEHETYIIVGSIIATVAGITLLIVCAIQYVLYRRENVEIKTTEEGNGSNAIPDSGQLPEHSELAGEEGKEEENERIRVHDSSYSSDNSPANSNDIPDYQG